jgi:DNA-binding PadR family transcriptional regulator
MEHKGLIQGEWGESENNRRAKFYTLTSAGRKQLKVETDKWEQMTDVVSSILGATPETR